MTDQGDPKLAQYYADATSWSEDRERASRRDSNRGWLVAAVAGAIALLEAIAIVVLLPLKTVEPYTLLVDKQTGYVEALKPLERQSITPDRAMIRSFLAQYVIAREGFDIDSLKSDYRKVALWSAEDARSQYIALMQANNPANPLSALPRRALLQVQIHSLSPLGQDTALVRFATTRTDPGGQPQPPMRWAAVLKYRFSGATMSAEDRLLNPLGFQVTRYDRDPEIVPEPVQTAPAVAATPAQAAIPGTQTANRLSSGAASQVEKNPR